MRRLLEITGLLLLAACQTPAPMPLAPPPPAPVCPEPPPAPPAPVDEGLKTVQAYATDLQKAMQLGQGRSAAEQAQAATQLEALASSSDPQAEPLKPLATLMAARLAEQRRLQDNVDKLNQQLRDSQRRNEQLNEKLEALKAIEQTLPAKPGAAPR
ncbi:hypothetical protein ACS5PN_06960 [Roseateles sp. NT4]|uniref:hypothetical protein n=1 Tax=Roseateles sp. NT4 TaxID=3453715 RepID=UPI003EE864BB